MRELGSKDKLTCAPLGRPRSGTRGGPWLPSLTRAEVLEQAQDEPATPPSSLLSSARGPRGHCGTSRATSAPQCPQGGPTHRDKQCLGEEKRKREKKRFYSLGSNWQVEIKRVEHKN